MREFKGFLIMLFVMFFGGFTLFYYFSGGNLNAISLKDTSLKLVSQLTEVAKDIQNSGTSNIHRGYVDSGIEVGPVIDEKEMEDMAIGMVDEITKEYTGMTMNDMFKEIESLLP